MHHALRMAVTWPRAGMVRPPPSKSGARAATTSPGACRKGARAAASMGSCTMQLLMPRSGPTGQNHAPPPPPWGSRTMSTFSKITQRPSATARASGPGCHTNSPGTAVAA